MLRELGAAPLEEAPLGLGVDKRESAVVRVPRFVDAAEPAEQLRARRMEVVVAVELETVREREAASTSPASASAAARLSSTTSEPVRAASSP